MSQANDSINLAGQSLNDQVKGIRALFLLVAELGFSLTMPFLRSKFGERYFSPFMIVTMSLFTLIMCYVMKVNPTYIGSYMALLIAVSVYHLIVIRRRNAKDEQWHTRFEGYFNIGPLVSRLPKGTDYWFVEGLYEPVTVLVTGILINIFLDVGLGNLLMFSSLWMVFRARYHYFLYREKILDERDALIESEYKLEALNGSPVSETKGFIVKNVSNMKPQDRRAIERSMLGEKDFSGIS